MSDLPDDKFDQRPYLKLLETIGPIRIFEVDGKWVRKHLFKEFTNWAQGRDPRFKSVIPPDEFWIDQGYNPDELQYFIDNMFMQWYLMGKGYSRSYAEREGTKIEEKERNRNGKKITKRELFQGHPEIRMLNWIGPLEIWLVDAERVRRKDSRFCHGGHDLVYDYIPDHHIWIDNTTIPNEWPYLIIHEVNERNLMDIGEPYKTAHPKSSRIEWQCRWDKNELLRQQKQLGLV